MKKINRLYTSIIIMLIICLSLNVFTLADEMTKEDTYEAAGNNVWISDNVNDNNYVKWWSSVMYSNLAVLGDGRYMRVEYGPNNKIRIEYFDSEYNYLQSWEIMAELPKFGGFYSDGSNYYIVYGQDNPSNNDSVEIIRVVKYDQNWGRQCSYSLLGGNSSEIFAHGNLRMDSDDEHLYVMTCHKMYNGHQANLYLKLKKSDLSEVMSLYLSKRYSYRYTSHSFNQFIKVLGDHVYTLNHGDAYPRSAALTKSLKTDKICKAGMNPDTIDIITYYGNIGENDTGSKLGGMELTANAIVTVGTSTDQNGADNKHKVYLSSTPIGDFRQAATTIKWFGGTTGSMVLNNPQLVKINDRRLLLIVNKYSSENSELDLYLLDENANVVNSRSFSGKTSNGKTYNLSDCQPVYNHKNNQVTWYVTDGQSMRICCIDAGSLDYKENMLAEYKEENKDKVSPFVERLYTLVLNRPADADGLSDWAKKLAMKEITGAEAAKGFFMSSEMTNRGLSNEEYVKICYRTMLNREADEGGLKDWVGQLDNGSSRFKVLAGFTDSQEFLKVCEDYGIERGELSSQVSASDSSEEKSMGGIRDFVARCYTKALGRKYEEAGLLDWAGRIERKEWTAEQVASDGFFHSQEFVNKNTSNEEYVEILYRTFLGREFDAAGRADWVGRLSQGVSRDDVMYGFSRSAEFANIMAQYGL